ncbi:MAG: InlB B-repeat-containing protein, partial [Clostridia bacterium]|nr:InlB B-repeat-containing protein [Clostridia bacterium]
NTTKETTYARITGTGASISSTLKLEENSSYVVTVSYIYDESINKNALKIGGGNGWADGEWWISSTNNINSYTVSSTKPSTETTGGTGGNQEGGKDTQEESKLVYYTTWKDLPIDKTDTYYKYYFDSSVNPYFPYDAPYSPNYPSEYKKDGEGEYVYGNCTWYCWARASEILVQNGKSPLTKSQLITDPSGWFNCAGGLRVSKSTNAQPKTNSIAVYSGHVRYIEYADENLIIYTESGYRDTNDYDIDVGKTDPFNGGKPTWLCFKSGTATKNSSDKWVDHGPWGEWYGFTVGSNGLLGYIYLDVGQENTPTINTKLVSNSSKSSYTTNENVTIKWNTYTGASSYGLTISRKTGSSWTSREIVYDKNGLTGNSVNVGKLPTGEYRFNMGAYSSGGSLLGDYSVLNYFTVVSTSNEEPEKYTITYNANGGTGAPSSQTKSHDIAITLNSATPIREGYTFQGWATSANGNVVYTPGDNYTANSSITLYAVWDDNKNWSNWSDWDDEVITSSDYRQVQTKNVYVYYHYILTYSSNGQSGAYAIEKEKMNALYPSDPASTQNHHTYYSDTKLSQVDSFTYYGKTYRAYKNLCPQDSSYTFGDNAYHLYDDGTDTTKTLYRYRDIQYNIEYEANGGTGAPAAQTKTHGTALALSSTTPTRTGYTFKGWATTASGSVSYAPGASFTTNADTILYAVWKSNTVSVTGVTLSKTAATLTDGDTLTLTATIAPSNATNKNVTWTSSNTSVATVNTSGVVTAKAAGTATITVKTADGGKSAECKVVVVESGITAKLKIGDVTCALGQTVRVPITLPNNPGIAGVEFTLQFDASALEIVDIEYDNWGGFDNKEQVRPENELSFSFHSAGNYTKEALCTLVFKVKDDAKTGEYSLKIIDSFACNENLLDIELSITAGAVRVLDYIIGDSNGDGKINTKDVVLIAQYIAGWDVTINTAAIDCSGDGIVNTKDVVLLAQFIAGWDVKLG